MSDGLKVFKTGPGHMVGGVADSGRPITYAASTADFELARKCASRAVDEAKQRQGVEIDWWLVYMDLMTWHCNIDRLNLLGLLLSGPLDFQQDICGIGVNIDRANARGLNGFRPQYVERVQ